MQKKKCAFTLLPKGKGVLRRAKDRTIHSLEAKRAFESLNHIYGKQCSATGKCILKPKSGLTQEMKMKHSISPELTDAVQSSVTDFFQLVFHFDLLLNL